MGSLRGTKRDQEGPRKKRTVSLSFTSQAPEEDWGVRLICPSNLRTFRIMNGSSRPGTRLSVLTGVDAEFLHA